MEIRYIRHDKIDKHRWDEIIDRSRAGRVYAYSWYLDILASRWDALILGDYEVIMPLPYDFKYGIGYIATPLFVQQLGLFSENPADSNLYIRFLNAIPSKFRYINLAVNIDSDFSGFHTRKRTNYILDINRPYEEIRAHYRPDAKKRIKNKEAFHYTETADIKNALTDYRMYNKMMESKVKPYIYDRLEDAFVLAQQKNKLISTALKTNSGEILATALFLLSHGRSYYIAGSQSPEGKKKYATHILIDRFIEKNCQTVKIFDFEGSDIPGVAEFFKKWGSIPEYYTTVIHSRFPVNLFIP